MRASNRRQGTPGPRSTTRRESGPDVLVVGAGPYGLSVAAHLRAAGARAEVFGEPMGFWRNNTPVGMRLVSTIGASDISDPRGELTLAAFAADTGTALREPLPAEIFTEYGLWFQRRAVPDVDTRHVRSIEPVPGGYAVCFEDGEVRITPRVVIATGMRPFAQLPAPFDALPADLASHSSDHRELGALAGRRVLVVGGGQSAVMTAALACATGAEVELVVRGPELHWAERRIYHRLGRFRRLAYAPSEVGPAGLSWVVALPRLLARLPADARAAITARATRPCGAGWLRDEVASATITTGVAVRSAEPVSGDLRVLLTDGTDRLVDHAIVATGFPVDIDRLSFVSAPLRSTIRRIGRAPLLDSGYQTSAPGLHIVGAASAATFGPVMRFVSGTRHTSRRVAHAVAGHAGHR